MTGWPRSPCRPESACFSAWRRLRGDGCTRRAPGGGWPALSTLGILLLALVLAIGPGHLPKTSRSHQAALLGAATGISWGFVAAVIKKLSSHLGDGTGAIFANWSPYVLVDVGAATMLLASHALAAGPLATSQPGFTILDPLSASLLGMFLFREHIQAAVPYLAGEAAALAIVIADATALSHSQLVVGGMEPRPPRPPDTRRTATANRPEGDRHPPRRPDAAGDRVGGYHGLVL